MDKSVDLLLITWNRIDYVKRTLENLLNDSADFRLYCWDNGSKDGTSDLIAECNDERIVEKHFCPVNVMQAFPTDWFLERCQSDIIGKVDDDTLVPAGWIENISEALLKNKILGMVGCWTFMLEDFDRNEKKARRKIVKVGDFQILHNLYIGGTAFLMRKEYAVNYLLPNHNGRAFPIDRHKMTEDGYISGWIYPLLFAEHMDDPRSEHCLMNKPGGMNSQAALTAVTRNIKTPEQYQEWIMKDADDILSMTVSDQLREYYRKDSLLGKVKRKILGH